MIELTLMRRNAALAKSSEQVKALENGVSWPRFSQTLTKHDLPPLTAAGIEVMQINVGKLCNQTCHHCHVDAGPDRRELMTLETAAACLYAMEQADIPTLDITGGAPEMNPHFQWIVEEARGMDKRVIDRCNLTILTAPGFKHLPKFLADHEVEVVASLPCYLEDNCDRQRGDGVFQRSITALRLLNELGYGGEDGRLPLTLVYNPIGATLPPPQEQLEADYRRELRARYGVEFTRLFTITNLPVSRFLDDLLQTGQYEQYMEQLVDAFNPIAAGEVMCRTMISVDWRGRLFDCDFNQMLELSVDSSAPQTIDDFSLTSLASRPIVTGRHCYGCTAGAGSSCQGRLVVADLGR